MSRLYLPSIWRYLTIEKSQRDRLCALYDEFCEGHRAASDAVKRADARPEFAAFEKACAAHGLDNTDRSPTDAPVGESSTLAAVTPSTDPQPASSSMMMTPTDEPVPALQHSHSDPVPAPIEIRQPSSTRLSILKPRRHSLGAADAHTTPKLTPKPFTKGHASSGSTSSTGDRRPALRFSDYLIKPVQRICRYQLLLAQLVPVGTAAGECSHFCLIGARGSCASRRGGVACQGHVPIRAPLPVLFDPCAAAVTVRRLATFDAVVPITRLFGPATPRVCRRRWVAAFTQPPTYLFLFSSLLSPETHFCALSI